MRNAIASAALILVFGATTLLADDPSVLFSDDFSTLDPAWGIASDQFFVAGGKMIIKPMANGFGTPLYQGTTFNDVDMTVKITQTGGTPDPAKPGSCSGPTTSATITCWHSGPMATLRCAET